MADNSEANTSSPGLGRLHFSIGYDFNNRSLTIKIHEAESLPAKDLSGTSDPYVKVVPMKSLSLCSSTFSEKERCNKIRYNDINVRLKADDSQPTTPGIN